jgi:hypothetical protein
MPSMQNWMQNPIFDRVMLQDTSFMVQQAYKIRFDCRYYQQRPASNTCSVLALYICCGYIYMILVSWLRINKKKGRTGTRRPIEMITRQVQLGVCQWPRISNNPSTISKTLFGSTLFLTLISHAASDENSTLRER